MGVLQSGPAIRGFLQSAVPGQGPGQRAAPRGR